MCVHRFSIINVASSYLNLSLGANYFQAHAIQFFKYIKSGHWSPRNIHSSQTTDQITVQ